jgi:hypothetical protein
MLRLRLLRLLRFGLAHKVPKRLRLGAFEPASAHELKPKAGCRHLAEA